MRGENLNELPLTAFCNVTTTDLVTFDPKNVSVDNSTATKNLLDFLVMFSTHFSVVWLIIFCYLVVILMMSLSCRQNNTGDQENGSVDQEGGRQNELVEQDSQIVDE